MARTPSNPVAPSRDAGPPISLSENGTALSGDAAARACCVACAEVHPICRAWTFAEGSKCYLKTAVSPVATVEQGVDCVSGLMCTAAL